MDLHLRRWDNGDRLIGSEKIGVIVIVDIYGGGSNRHKTHRFNCSFQSTGIEVNPHDILKLLASDYAFKFKFVI